MNKCDYLTHVIIVNTNNVLSGADYLVKLWYVDNYVLTSSPRGVTSSPRGVTSSPRD